MRRLSQVLESGPEPLKELHHSDDIEQCDIEQDRVTDINCWSLSGYKRLFDVTVSLAVLTAGFLPLLLIFWIIKLTSKGPALFVQKRVGQNGQLFSVYKLRTMSLDARSKGIGLTQSGDARVTSIGRWLRKLKLDELPQFLNVLRGEMSVVGPRPKLPEYADDLNLIYRPGITGAASLAFRNEEELLALVPPEQVESYYQERIKPAKANIDREYMQDATVHSDFRILLSTLVSSLRPNEVLIPDLVSFEFGAMNSLNSETAARYE